MEPFEEASETDVSDDEQSHDEEPRIKNVLEDFSKTVSRERASDLLHSMAASKDILFWTPRGQILRRNRIIPVRNMLFKVYQFIQLIKEPTKIVERSSTLLDLAFTTDQGKISDSGVLECSISDHSLVYIIRKARPPRGPIKTIKCRNYKNYSAPNFVSDLHSASWDVINTSLTVDEAWTSFKDIFVTIADRHAPTRTRRVRSNTLP